MVAPLPARLLARTLTRHALPRSRPASSSLPLVHPPPTPSSSSSHQRTSPSTISSSSSTLPSSRRSYSLHAPTPSSSSNPSLSTPGPLPSASAADDPPSIDRPTVVPPDRALVASLAEADGLDEPDWVPEHEAFMLIAPSAWSQLAKIAKRERSAPEGDRMLWFRVAVDSGGCHGYQYKMDLADQPAVDDYVLHPPSSLPSSFPAAPLPVLIDHSSMALLKGATLDFTTELIGSSFRIRENPQAKGAGCGCGVSWEAK